MNRSTLLALVILCSLIGMAGAQADAPACTTSTLALAVGPVCGTLRVLDGVAVHEYLGIPFGEDTGGQGRFAPPAPKAPWTELLAATAFGPPCPQNAGFTASIPYLDEDCLSLNVWAPASGSAGRAVLVFIHGGAFVDGSGGSLLFEGGPPVYDGAYLAAREDIVVVTLNYRLGVLGFLAGLAGVDGNYGLLDQQLALRWVRDHIRAFGGDPARVTLSGESAGAMATKLHAAVMPDSAGLFRAAILQSDPAGVPYPTPGQARSVALVFSAMVGCAQLQGNLACLRAVPVEEMLRVQGAPALAFGLASFGLDALVRWAPVVDGRVVTAQPREAIAAGALGMPLLLGVNGDEARLFLAMGGGGGGGLSFTALDLILGVLWGRSAVPDLESAYVAQRRGSQVDAAAALLHDGLFLCPNLEMASAAGGPTFVYSFTHAASFQFWPLWPACDERACHGEELPFVFASAVAAPVRFDAAEEELARHIGAYWGSFVRTGSQPGIGRATGTPAWPAWDTSGPQWLNMTIPLQAGPASTEHCSMWSRLAGDFDPFGEAGQR